MAANQFSMIERMQEQMDKVRLPSIPEKIMNVIQKVNETYEPLRKQMLLAQKAVMALPQYKNVALFDKMMENSPLLSLSSQMQKIVTDSPIFKINSAVISAFEKSSTFNVLKNLRLPTPSNEALKSIYSDAFQIYMNPHSTMHSELNSFYGEILDECIDPENLDISLKNVEKKVEKVVLSKIKKKKIAYFVLITLMYPIFLMLVGRYQTNKDNKYLDKRLDDQEKQTSSIIDSQEKVYDEIKDHKAELIASQNRLSKMIDEHLSDKTIPENTYVVQRITKLRSKPFPKSDVLSNLYPNQLVDVEMNKGKWIYVVYYDNLSMQTRTGWTLKKYLRKVSF